MPSQAPFARIVHLTLSPNSEFFLFGAAHLLGVVDIVDPRYFLHKSDAQRHQRFAAFDQRAVRHTGPLSLTLRSSSSLSPLPVDLEDEPPHGLLVARAPRGAQFGERGWVEERNGH
jgi:hypothetical protein